MKKYSTKGVLLFTAVMALCAFAMPSMASASSWAPIGTEHRLDTSDFGFFNDVSNVQSMCANAQFTIQVANATSLEINGATFLNCTAAGAIGHCTMSSTATNLPWTATARTTSDIQIHGVNLDVFFTGAACGVPNTTLRMTGTITNARWLGNSSARRIELAGAHGVTSHFGVTSSPVTLTGTVTDTTGDLAVN